MAEDDDAELSRLIDEAVIDISDEATITGAMAETG